MVAVLAVSALGAGCAQGGGGVDAGGIVIRVDGGMRDGGRDAAGAMDASSRTDAAVIRDGASSRDAGSFRDSDGVNLDAGGPMIDAGFDAGFDAGMMCSASPCRLAPPQCGCASGQSCSRVTGSTLYCRANGAGTDGATCTDDANCAAGFECAGGQCHRFCTSDAECVGPGAECVLVLSSGGVEIPGSSICSISCDPISDAGCPGGTSCRLNRARVHYTECSPTGSRGLAASCTSRDQCSAFLDCLVPPGEPGAYCLPFCRNDGDCPLPFYCSPVNWTIDGAGYGACIL